MSCSSRAVSAIAAAPPTPAPAPASTVRTVAFMAGALPPGLAGRRRHSNQRDGWVAWAAEVRIWFDMTAPAHPIVFRPVIELLRAAGHDVHVTARDYAQTLPLLRRLGMPHTVIGRHGGASRTRKAAALASRTARMIAHGQ